jgi:hypothetical protein
VALAGLALLIASASGADQTLRDDLHRKYKHQSYMLIEDAYGTRLYLFDEGGLTLQLQEPGDPATKWTDAALDKLHSTEARVRVRGLTELAGVAEPAALDAALALLTDPSPAVREEAAQLILDHPDGGDLVDALGISDELEED